MMSEWNPYPQTKPNETGYYLVSIKKIWKDCTVTDRLRVNAFYDEDSHPWLDIGDYEKVVAWMELPEPYQKEEEIEE